MFKEILGEAFPIIEKASPLIAGVIGGPYAGTALAAIKVVANAFGANPYNFKDIIDKIIFHPDAAGVLATVADKLPESMVDCYREYLPSEFELSIKAKWPSAEKVE